MDRITLGSFEVVSLPEFHIFNTVAKVDTGAYSGAFHCSKIEEVKDELTGKKRLRFTPSDHRDLSIESSDYSHVDVRSSNGHMARRFLVKTVIEVQQKQYPIVIGLTDRSKLNFEMLIGRRFIREQNMLVDVRVNEDYDIEGGQA